MMYVRILITTLRLQKRLFYHFLACYVTSGVMYVHTPSSLEQLQYVACDVAKLCTKYERNQAIGGGVIAISVF